MKIRTYKDLFAWQKAHEITLSIYRHTKKFPKEELFGLTSQIRRSAISVTSNIAEGFARISYKEKQQFYSVALGSLMELESQIIVAKDLEYLAQTDYSEIELKVTGVGKLIQSLIKTATSKPSLRSVSDTKY